MNSSYVPYVGMLPILMGSAFSAYIVAKKVKKEYVDDITYGLAVTVLGLFVIYAFLFSRKMENYLIPYLLALVAVIVMTARIIQMKLF